MEDGGSRGGVGSVLTALGGLVLFVALVAYTRGWRRLRAIGQRPPAWRLAVYGLGLTTAAAALIGLDELGDERFSMHMVQHLLLVMLAAPLVTLGNPLPCVLWGLPRGARAAFGRTLRPGAKFRRALGALTFMPVAGALYAITVWVWHVPFLYDAAVEHEVLHALEHTMFLGTAILFWWPIVQPAPRLHPRAHPGLADRGPQGCAGSIRARWKWSCPPDDGRRRKARE